MAACDGLIKVVAHKVTAQVGVVEAAQNGCNGEMIPRGARMEELDIGVEAEKAGNAVLAEIVAEGKQRDGDELDVLERKGDADDGDGEDQRADGMR